MVMVIIKTTTTKTTTIKKTMMMMMIMMMMAVVVLVVVMMYSAFLSHAETVNLYNSTSLPVSEKFVTEKCNQERFFILN